MSRYHPLVLTCPIWPCYHQQSINQGVCWWEIVIRSPAIVWLGPLNGKIKKMKLNCEIHISCYLKTPQECGSLVLIQFVCFFKAFVKTKYFGFRNDWYLHSGAYIILHARFQLQEIFKQRVGWFTHAEVCWNSHHCLAQFAYLEFCRMNGGNWEVEAVTFIGPFLHGDLASSTK